MGQAQEPISPTTQQLSVLVPSITNSDGEGVWTFQNPPAGLTWTGTLTVSGGVSGAVFDVYIGGALWGTFSGGAVFGPVQVRGQGSQQLVVTGSELLQDTLYTMTLIGSSDSDWNVQPIYPEPSGASTTVVQGNRSVSVVMDSRLTAGVTTLTAPDYLPAMAVGDQVLLADSQYLAGFFVSWEMILADTLGDGGPRRWLITLNEVSIETPFWAPQIPLASQIIQSPKWTGYISVSTNLVKYVGVTLLEGEPVLNNQIQVSVTGFSNSQVQAVTNVTGSTLGVSSYGGVGKFSAFGTVANVGKNGPSLPSWAPAGQYCIRLHSLAWENLGTSVLKVYADGAVIFAVSATTNSQPQTFVFDGLLCGTISASFLNPTPIYFATSTTLPTFGIYMNYDVVPIPAITYPY